jgi:RNA polymerase-associated protein LEO1
MDEDEESSSNSSALVGTPPLDSAAAPSMSNLFGDDEDDSSEDEEESSVGVAAAAAAGKKGSNRRTTSETAPAAESYDENDSDVEFDDAHAEIVGLARPEGSEEQTQHYMNSSALQQEQQLQRSGRTNDIMATSGSTGRSGQQQQPNQLQQHVPPQTLSVPDIPRPFASKGKGKGVTLHTTRLPNTLAIIHTAYDRDSYDPHEEEEMYGSTTLLSNIIRWRYARDANGALIRDPNTGKLVRESNARIIQWSDGTKSIKVGEELMDLDERINTTIDSAATPKKTKEKKSKNKTWRHFLYLSQFATQLPDETNSKVVEDPQQSMPFLECMGPIVSKLSARPSSLQSAAHKALTLQVRRRTVKRAKIAEIVTRADPEAEKAKRIAMKNDMIKEEMGKTSSGTRQRSSTGRRRTGLHSRSRNYDDNMSEEEEDRFDSVNIGAMKRRAKDTEEVLDYGDSEEEEEWEKSRSWKNQRNKARRKGRHEDEDDEDDDEVFQEESEDSEEEAPIRAKNKRAKIGVLEDDDDED